MIWYEEFVKFKVEQWHALGKKRMTSIEMIREWQRGCSCAAPGHPIECNECTLGLIKALEKSLMAKQETYKSTTLGPIPLSFTGRHLLQNLREAFSEMVAKVVKDVQAGKPVVASHDWELVSLARGRIAQYMSKLERGEGYTDESVQVEYRPIYDERCTVPADCPDKDAFKRTMNFAEAPETSADFLKRVGIDGDKWARDFMAKHFNITQVSDLDEMRAWFVNAIEAGRSVGYTDGYNNGMKEGAELERTVQVDRRDKDIKRLEHWIRMNIKP